MEIAPARPVLRYHGGKWNLAPWIISHFPDHRVYVEPFGGAASVLLRKPRSYAEIYNDLNSEIVNLFRVLRDPEQAERLRQSVRLTPFARCEYELSLLNSDDPIEQARRTLVKANMGSSSGILTRNKGFRCEIGERRPLAHEWPDLPEIISAAHCRLQGVIIEHRPAIQIIERYSAPDALLYADPPYVLNTRGTEAGNAYAYEMSDDNHREMAKALRAFQGAVVVSGYPCALYDGELFSDWRRVERPAYAAGAQARTEVLWISPNAIRQPSLF